MFFCFGKISFFVRFSSEKLRLHVFGESSFSIDSANNFLWINVYGVKIRDILFIFSFSSTLNQF